MYERNAHIIQLANRTAAEVIYKLTEYLNNLPQSLVKTLTWDRGMELADHEQLSHATGIKVYFADPHSPWQRGTNENTNGLLRQYLPKKTNLAIYQQHTLNTIANQLNTQPRKTLGYKTPLETHNQNVALTI